MMTVSRDILMHPDFIENMADELYEMLEALIDAEFDKGDDTDFDFIDECADAINAIRSGDTAQILPVISRRDFINKVSGSSHKTLRAALAVCAAIAVVIGANTLLKETRNIDVFEEVAGFFNELFGEKPVTIETTAPSMAPVQTAAPAVTGIGVELSDSFKSEYYVGEEFSADGISVFAEYDNGERKLLEKNGFAVIVSPNFGESAKYETVTIQMGSFREYLEVRVIDSISTKKLSSIYAIFPDDFDFTTDDLDDIGLDEMQVYAVYSNGEEAELSAGDYEVSIEKEKRLFEEYATVTVEHNGCSCSFMVFKAD
ncbi:MAG: bacterial Ig-like domain-containing protein [Clostridia bacterium]|nr:bacterial Ig-like domain-containing protein [Clostridia bacterium]